MYAHCVYYVRCATTDWVNALQIVAQLLSFPIMRLWARTVPNVKIFGIKINPGPFTIKEHVIITVMSNVGAQSAYAVSGRCRNFPWR